MSQEMSGSEKLKAKCQTMASLTPEEIAQVAGGYALALQNPLIKIPGLGGPIINGMPGPDIFRSGLLIQNLNHLK